MTTKTLAEQLSEKLGIPIPPSRNDATYNGDRDIRKSKTQEPLDEDRLINDIQSTLRDIKTGHASRRKLYDLVDRAGKRGLFLPPIEMLDETIIEYIVHDLAEDPISNSEARRIKLIRLAVLACTDKSIRTFRDFVVKETILGKLELKTHCSFLSKLERKFILDRLGHTEFYDRLEEVRKNLSLVQDQKARERDKKRRREELLRLISQIEKSLRQVAVDPVCFLGIKNGEEDAQVSSFWSSLTFDAKATHARYPMENRLTLKDIALVRLWSNLTPQPSSSFLDAINELEKDISKYNAERYLSARLGELVAMEYYRRLEGSVTDVSITQTNPSAHEWMTHDFEVDNKAFDVKNARRSFSNSQNYSEFFVKKFKVSEMDQRNVKIVGVLSDYEPLEVFQKTFMSTPVVLGQVDAEEMAILEAWLHKRFQGFLEVSLRGNNLIPGWMFEYPQVHQPRRVEARAAWSVKLKEMTTDEVLLNDIPRYLWVIGRINLSHFPFGISDSDLQILAQLQAMDLEIGLSRRSLFMFILAWSLIKSKSADTTFQPRDFKEWLFPKVGMEYLKTCPLGLQDTESYIWNIISALQTMWSRARQQLAEFQCFRLSNPNILKGLNANGEWQTVLAYCGGWRNFPVRARCGNNPIYLGVSDPCPECHRLICPKCGFCNDDMHCSLNAPRQAVWHTKESALRNSLHCS